MSPPPAAPNSESFSFSGEMSAPDRLAAAKAYLKSEQTALRILHNAGATGLTVVRARSASLDELLKALFDYAVASFTRVHGPLPMP
eukprot:gene38961-52624_t